MAKRIQLSKIDAFALATMIVAGIVIWSRGQYQGWSFLIVAIYFVLFELFCSRRVFNIQISDSVSFVLPRKTLAMTF